MKFLHVSSGGRTRVSSCYNQLFPEYLSSGGLVGILLCRSLGMGTSFLIPLSPSSPSAGAWRVEEALELEICEHQKVISNLNL